jgi:plastocyanin
VRTVLFRGIALALVLAALGAAGAGASGPAGSKVRGKFTSFERLKTKGDTSERDVVVYLEEKEPRPHAAPAEPAVVRQERLVFKPHVLAVMAGTTVRFENLDSVVHNVYSADACCSVDLEMPAAGREEAVVKAPGVAAIVCRLHPDMSMFVVALANPFFDAVELVKSAGEGDERPQYSAGFEIDGVPPGEYVLTFWNKRLEPRRIPITVEGGKDTVCDVTIDGQQ